MWALMMSHKPNRLTNPNATLAADLYLFRLKVAVADCKIHS